MHGEATHTVRKVFRPLAPIPNTNDTLVADAVVQGFTAGVITPDGRVLIADQSGLRLLDNSKSVQQEAVQYLVNDMNNLAGGLNTPALNLTAWHMLLQTLATKWRFEQ